MTGTGTEGTDAEEEAPGAEAVAPGGGEAAYRAIPFRLQVSLEFKHIPMLMRELLGPEVPERYVHYCAVSTVSQCVDAVGRVRLAEVRGGKQVPEPAGRHVRENIEEYADHVAAFSLAGIRAVRARFAGEGEKAACAE